MHVAETVGLMFSGDTISSDKKAGLILTEFFRATKAMADVRNGDWRA
jgi:hypothetical protein